MVRMQTAASSADDPPPQSTHHLLPCSLRSFRGCSTPPSYSHKQGNLIKTPLFTLFPSKTAISQASTFPSPTGPPSLPARLVAHLVGGEDGQLPLLAAQLLEAHTGGSSWSEDRQGVAGGPSTSTTTTTTNITSRHSWLRGRPNLLNSVFMEQR